MAKEVSQDFAKLLSALHQEVEGLKSVVKEQSETIKDLQKELKSTQERAVRAPSQKIRQASLTSADNLPALAALASTPIDEELVRHATPIPAATPASFVGRQDLMQNYIASKADAEPVLAVVVEDAGPAHPTYIGPSVESLKLERAMELARRESAYKALLPPPERGIGRMVNRSPIWAGPFDQ